MTGKKLVDTILVALMLVITLGVTGLFYYTEKVFKKPPINEAKEKEALMKASAEKTLPDLFRMEPMMMSLIPKDSKNTLRMRYLELEVYLVLFESSDKDFLKENLPIVQDKIMDIATKMAPEELSTLSGKMLLENRIKTELNTKFHRSIIKSIFFSKYIVQ